MEKQRRNTKTKQMVMRVLESSRSALCHEDIEKQLSGTIDRVTIYRILQGFCDDGKVHKISGENGKTYYALCYDCSIDNHHDNHLHFRCLKCETVTCIDEPVSVPKLPKGYSISSIAFLISGFCSKCQPVVKTLCCALLFFIAQASLSAQTQVKVLGKDTNEPIAFANVYFPDTKTGTYTDSEGIFSVNTSNQSVLTQISYLGYKTYLEILFLQDANQVIYLEPSAHELQEIVVSENASRLQGENVVNVEKLTLNHNAELHGFSLAEKLSSVSGVNNWSTGAGIGKPVIRGLSGNRIAIFSQGVRIENQQWGDEHGLGLDENGYEQVEIIKGAASLLYGSDALGGVLYFVDERYAKENSIEAVLGSEFHSNTKGWRNTGAFKLSKNRFHWNMFGGYTTHKDYKDGNNNFVNNSRFRTSDFKTAFGYTGNKFTTSLKYGYLNEQYGLTELEEDDDKEQSYRNGRKAQSPFQDLTTHLVSSENTFFFDDNSKLKIDLGYIFNNRKEFEDDVAALDMNLNTFSYNAKWYSPKIRDKWTFTAGSQGMYQTNKNKGEEVLIPNAVTTDIGVFAVSDFHYSKRAYWQTGLRIDERHISGKEYGTTGDEDYIPAFSKSYFAFNFSTGIFQPIAENWLFRANLSSGYRAPNMFELLSDGVHEGTNRYEIGDTQLKTENNYQIDASLTYKSEHLELFVNPYFNYIRNYIYLQPSAEEIDDMPVYYYNQTNAYLYGGETGFHLHPHPLDWLHLDASYSNTFGRNRLHDNLPLIPSQKINATVSANFSWEKTVKRFSVYAQSLYSFAQKRVAAYELFTGDYFLLNVGFAFEFGWNKQKLLLNISVNNLTNKTYYDHLSRYKTDGIYNIGRNFNFKLNIPLQWKL
ncbi:MAG: TonB-dependent receptor [Prevotellaceae bacterium]|jgi:iron complex outermembrane receptor protein|nr:TonB-dependent receptor [Prevotellaceae bacterium]